MAGLDRVKEQILEKADIGEVVGQYVRLQNRNGRLFGLCPFHQEKTPSFSVNPERGFFHCFGCGKGGNAIDFIMGVENLTYAEARRHLAEKLGIKIDTPSGRPQAHAEIDRYQVMDQAAQFYAKCLQSSPVALQYLQSRELQPQHVKQFGLGFAPNEWDSLLTAFRRRDFPEKVMVELGLIIPRKEGSGYYDRFRNRVMFPIRNTLGRVIAFGGRALDPKDNAKYLNSNDTPLFNKSKVLYLLDRAKDVLKDRGAVLVEGYMDAISLHARGFTQAVASLGTALTMDHIHILRRYTNDFTLLYDGDSAGIKAAMRGVELFFETGHPVRVALLPGGMDPDDFIKKHGAEAMQTFLSQAGDGFRFYVEQTGKNYDFKTTQGKMEIVEATIPLFARIDDPLLFKECVVQLARKLDNQESSIVESAILKKLKTNKNRTYSAPHQPEMPKGTSSKNDSYAIIKEPLIRLLAFYRGLITPKSMSVRQALTFYSDRQIETITNLLQPINEQSILDRILIGLIQAESKPVESNIAARLSQIFPENDVQSRFIALSESEPLPSDEKDLHRMMDDIQDTMTQIQEKRKRTEILNQAKANPQKALAAFNEILLAERKNGMPEE